MKFKHQEDMELFFKLHPVLMVILTDMYSYCYDNNMEFVITDTISTIEEDRKLKRVSSTHRTHRAADIRIKNWDNLELKDFQNHFNQKYKDFASVNSSGEPRLVVIHDAGYGSHGHIQIHSRYKL